MTEDGLESEVTRNMSKFFEALEQAEQERLEQERVEHDKHGEARQPAENPAPLAKSMGPDAVEPQPVRTPVAPARRKLPRETHAGALEDHLVTLLSPAAADAEQYKTLCCAVEEAHASANLKVVAVTSPGAGEGKTLTSINMAATLAQTPENRVLLIDADLREPSLASHFGLNNFDGPGFIDAIQDSSLTLKDVERTLPAYNLTIVTAGQALESPYEALKSRRTESFLEEARQRYDYIVVDTPPVIPVPDCRVIARWVEGFLVIVAAHRTPKKLLEETLNALEPNKVLGLVFNRDDFPLANYYGYSYAYGRYGQQSRRQLSNRLIRKMAPSRVPAGS
jgi:capsular exopolysaccharide synthesis family protein